MSDWVDVAAVEDFPPGACRVLHIDDAAIAVVNVAGQCRAIEDVCSHDGAALIGGDADAPAAFIEGEEITCPRHGARFCLKTGAALSPPAYEPIPTFPTRIEGGMVQVRDDRWD